MNQAISQEFPGGSKSRVNLAGNNIRTNSATIEDLLVIEEWRAAHRAVLNTFQAILRNRTRGTNIMVAQRHKRKSTIAGKLARFPEMQLARMDDVAGCRLIFPDIQALNYFREVIENGELVKQFLKSDHDLRLLNTLLGLNSADATISANRNTILIFSESGELEVRTYRDAPEALRALFQLEKEFPGKDIVLVKADTSEEVRFAFKNYFSDAQDFVRLIEEGCKSLSDSGVDGQG